jgi:hypothetical protein
LLGAAATADVRLALVIPGYDSAENAALSDDLLANADWAQRKGFLDLASGEAVQIKVLADGCDPVVAQEVAARRGEPGTPKVVVGDCGDNTLAVAAAYAGQGLPFIVPFAQDVGGAAVAPPGVIQIEPGGAAAAHALASALRDSGRVVEGQVAVLTEAGSFGAAFFQRLVAEEACGASCRLVSVPWPQEKAPPALTEAQWVIYAGWDVDSLGAVVGDLPSDQHWLIYHRGRTSARDWLALVNAAAYSDQDFTIAVPAITERRAESAGFPSANAIFFLAAAQVAAQELQAIKQKPETDEAVFEVVDTIIGELMIGKDGEVSVQYAVSTYSPVDYLQRLVDWGEPIGALAKESAMPGDNPTTVYNLLVAPLESRSPLVLEPGVETTLSFSLGPNLEANVLGIAPVNPRIEELAEGRKLKLGVTLNCFVCATESYQRRTIEYDPDDGVSVDPALFTIVPDPEHTDPVTAKGLLLFTVDAGGVDLDVIHVPLFVGRPTPTQAEKWVSPAVRPVRHGTIVDEDLPDLVIDVATAAGALPITLIPHLPELRAAMERELGTSQDGAWIYQSGVNKADLEGLVRSAYVELRAMIEQHEALRAYFAALDRDPVLSSAAARLDLDESDRAAMLNPLRRHGARIYDRTFMRGDRGLREGIRLVEDFAAPDGRPLRVVFRVSDVYAPWQLLYPNKTGPIDVERFWGFRYELGTRQLVDAAQATLLTRMDKPTADQTLFAAYRSDRADDVAARANLFARHVDDLLPKHLDVADSRKEFLDRLTHEGYKLRLIIAYGHATSGTVVDSSSGVRPIMTEDAGGPRFAFAKAEYLEPADIDDYTPPPDDGLLLASQPVVLFNACETGGGGVNPMNNNGFVGALTRAGARAVIVTETPVWNNFAYHFGQHVFDGLVQGLSVSAALRNARLRHLREWNNPLGLVYTLYGNPAARIE